MASFKGIDVSKHQGKIDWNKVKSAGIQFAMIRAGYGRYDKQKDEQFEANYSGAKAAGIPVGAYHYSYAENAEQAKAEAQTLLNWIKGKTFEYPIAFDIEEADVYNLGKNAVSEIIKAFCSTVEAAGYYVCVYANKNWLDNVISDEVKKKYDTWLAQWTTKPTYNGNYGIWQYSSSGSVNGISGRVDMNTALKDYPSIIKGANLNGLNNGTNQTNKNDQGVTSETTNKLKAHTRIVLNNAPLYASSTTSKVAAKKTGVYYIYDGIEMNGRYRITNSDSNVGRTPIAQSVTGYVNKKDIKVG